jgi:hypothetical protein
MFSRATALFTLVFVGAMASLPTAQSDPRTLPTVNLANVKVLGTWTFDWPDGAGGDISYGGGAVGVSEDGRYLYISCHQDDKGIAKLEIPALGGRARVIEPCRGPDRAEIAKIHPDPSAFRPMLGGVLEMGGRVTVTGYISYDASGATTASHWGGPALNALSGPYATTVAPGFVKSQMAAVPMQWRALLGGPALASAGYTSIISRASHGTSVSVFNPDDVGVKNPIPMTMLLGCPHSVPSCITYGTPTSNEFNGSELSGGFFVVPNTRTLVAIEREASGPTCYGYATHDQSLHGKDHPGPDDADWCYSLSDPLTDKGPKGYPYRLVAKVYDLKDLVDVKQGLKKPWDVKQYATVDLPGSGPNEFVKAGAYNPVRGEYYLLRYIGGGVNTVHVYGNWGDTSPPPPIEKCGDGIDNDGDGQIDEGCVEVCGDGLDNDNDGQVDEGCPTNEKCGDGIDNDGDGLVDEGCPVPEKCGDLIDNDLDGLVDEGCEQEVVEICGDNKDNDGDGKIDEECEGQGAVPGAPRRLYGSVWRSTVSLKWFPPLTGGTVWDYVIEAGFEPGQTAITAPVENVTFVTVPNVGRGRYYVRVRARNPNGLGKPSNEVVLSVGCSDRPRRPTGFSATSRGGLVTLSWTDPDGCSGTRFNVEVGTSAGNLTTMSTEEAEATTVLPAGNYVARVKAQAETGVSDPADLSFTVTGNGCVAPRLRLKLRTVVSGRRVGFFWSPLDPEIAAEDDRLSPVSYVIEAGSVAGATDLAVAPLGRATQFIVDAPPGLYHIRVRPTNSCGGGQPSNEMKVVVR